MDFKDVILQLSDKISKQIDGISTEEATKTAFIMPMISALGYDVFNPFEVMPEMDCDLAKRGEKIDYAIMKDGKPIILIECKHCKQNLTLHNTQLARYYIASNARFGILTNGIEYRFYTDIHKVNVMDENPFMVINMLGLSDTDIEQLKSFHKSYFDEKAILSTAQELQITIQVKKLLEQNFKQPGDEFTRYFVRCLNDWKSNQKLIEQYKPIIKKTIASVIGDMISDRLSTAMKVEESEPSGTDGNVAIDGTRGVVTTQEEIDAYHIVRDILKQYTKEERIQYRDFKSYFAINLDGIFWHWICRLSLKPYSKRMGIPINGYGSCEWIKLDTIEDIRKHQDKLKIGLDVALAANE
ncbi:type I restriction endonuclease [uncultured Bacteroides sp.]|uniref:type I restriction endonuclease n=1 Tax=uncultured Bacteroides sp. TaxID=162156 RepID=UPI00260E4F8D|nr:type I restriction endonuclease [uncultured Bacteroides sp.]